MGSIRVNLTNGSSKYINLDNSTTASVVDASRQSTTIDVDGNPYEIPRFETSNGGVIWQISMEVAYTAISATPIDFGYPVLASNLDPKAYIKYDVNKFGNSTLASALNADAGNIDSVWTERTAISPLVTSEDEGESLLSKMQAEFKDGESEAFNILAECKAETASGSTYIGPNCVVEPINGGVNDAGCQECSDSFLSTVKSNVAARAGEIEWKHQYLFGDLITPQN